MHNPTISIMKGIAIIGVVAGHCGVSQWTENFVNQWHLAVFFFVAGMCFKEKYTLRPKLYIKRTFFFMLILSQNSRMTLIIFSLRVCMGIMFFHLVID